MREIHRKICTDLKATLAEGHRDYSLLNLVKGVPFLCSGRLKDVDEESALFAVQLPEAAFLKLLQSAIVLSDGLLEPLAGEIRSYDPVRGELVLGDFTYAGSKFSNRQELRVEPAEPIRVIVTTQGQVLAGELVDLATRGAGLRLPAVERVATIQPGQWISLTLDLPEGPVQLEAQVRQAGRKASPGRISVEFRSNLPAMKAVVRYLIHRRLEIMAEVQELWDQTRLSGHGG